ncbi:MAG: hypothetical protein R2682_02305 [Pyrinomonadaceae bacterium]
MVFVVTLLIFLFPPLLFVRAFFSKVTVSSGHLLGIVLYIVAASIGGGIIRAMISDGSDFGTKNLGDNLCWFINHWGFLYVNGLVLLGFLFLWRRQTFKRSA